MIKFELKKIYSQSIVIGSLAVLLLICFVLIQAYCFNNQNTVTTMSDGTQLSGREAIVYNQSVAEKYEGDFTDDTIAKMVLDFSTNYPNEYKAMLDDEPVNSAIPSTYLYLNMFIPPENYDEIAQDAISQGSSIPPLTETGLISVRDYGTAFVDKPLQYGYSDSWTFFFMGFCGPTLTIAIPTLIVIIIAVSTIFSNEYSTKMDALILTTRYGKNRQIIAKLLVSIIFTTILIVGLFILFCTAFGLQYGLSGWNADIQTNLALPLMGVELPFNNLQMILFGLIIVWMAGVFSAIVTAMISAITKTSFSSLIISFAIFVIPGIIREMIPQSTLRDMFIVFPINAVDVQDVLLSPIYFNQPLTAALWIGIATIIVLFISSIIAYKAFRNHQITG